MSSTRPNRFESTLIEANYVSDIPIRFFSRPIRGGVPSNFVRYPSDGLVERIRPVTMKNSENGDFILCVDRRGSYIAWRKDFVPKWVVDLVRQIEFEQR